MLRTRSIDRWSPTWFEPGNTHPLVFYRSSSNYPPLCRFRSRIPVLRSSPPQLENETDGIQEWKWYHNDFDEHKCKNRCKWKEKIDNLPFSQPRDYGYDGNKAQCKNPDHRLTPFLKTLTNIPTDGLSIIMGCLSSSLSILRIINNFFFHYSKTSVNCQCIIIIRVK